MFKPATVFRIVLIGLIVLLVASVASAFAAANTIAPSNIGMQSDQVRANDLKPDVCAALNLTNVVTGSGTISGTPANDLILGTSGVDIIAGLGGNDCILGGGGADSIDGNGSTDVCIGGGGDDTFQNCETTIP
jgi:Ca2+-binding RTX toxin-like protein